MVADIVIEMNKNTKKSYFDIQSIAKLARIKVDAEQERELHESITKVLSFVDQIREADVPDVEPKDFFRLTKNRLRADEDPIEPGTYTDEIMRVAPDSKDGYLKVKKIITKTDN
jgi:aspartyl-tRNA(Asn)/glutamyl-tRNA(Gln) amidotransferase subunit C